MAHEHEQADNHEASLPITDVTRTDVDSGEAGSIKGGGTTKAIEIQDYGFGVTMPVTTSRSDGGGATVSKS